jgi:hypothetical protein
VEQRESPIADIPAVSETHLRKVKAVPALDNSPRLSPEQQAPLIAKLQSAEFREPDLASDLLGEGVWIAYAVFALVWFHSLSRRELSHWVVTAREKFVAPMVARQRVRGLAWGKGLRPRTPIFSKAAATRV